LHISTILLPLLLLLLLLLSLRLQMPLFNPPAADTDTVGELKQNSSIEGGLLPTLLLLLLLPPMPSQCRCRRERVAPTQANHFQQ
jgi:hypothetical protein